ncbi:GNAT family N-acetyltransferase [Maliponia aquimaris]|uniref:N-acetylglutamate synthase n=1 Tax=Maliponia aquimaris TaxID=1673631 RepID=A0A238KEN3_9RHOB|nr:GNAT family N-acetyltransferase [Maliponia aquimaris]SMX40456.1 N-acetylglutamate synthase [Maliponia aquimaris]
MSAAPGLTVAEAIDAADLDAVRDLCREYRAFLAALPAPDCDAVLHGYAPPVFDRLLDTLAQDHARPRGCLKLARQNGKPVGCGMARTLTPGVAEIKRLYVRPAARGTGTGRALMTALIDTCRTDGFARIVMDTGKPMAPAARLYLSLGFRTRGPYHDLPPDVAARMVFFEMDL